MFTGRDAPEAGVALLAHGKLRGPFEAEVSPGVRVLKLIAYLPPFEQNAKR